MRRSLIYVLIFIAPFLFVILVNESTKPKDFFVVKLNLPGKPKVAAYNTGDSLANKCTWDCHNHGCKHNKKKRLMSVLFQRFTIQSSRSINHLLKMAQMD